MNSQRIQRSPAVIEPTGGPGRASLVLSGVYGYYTSLLRRGIRASDGAESFGHQATHYAQGAFT